MANITDTDYYLLYKEGEFLLWICVWFVVYYCGRIFFPFLSDEYKKLPSSMQRYLDASFLSIVHSIYISSSVLRYGFSADINVGIEFYLLPVTFYSETSMYLIRVICAYFVVDTINSLIYMEKVYNI